MGVRHWVGALSVAAVLGVVVGAVYSGVTGWTGPGGRAAVAAGAGLPAPGEQPGRAVATASAAAVRSGPVRSAGPAAEPAPKVKAAKAKTPKAKAPKAKTPKVKAAKDMAPKVEAPKAKPAKDEAGAPTAKKPGKPGKQR